jgi:tight adherence protein B
MRGLAVIVAAIAAWSLAGGPLPRLSTQRPGWRAIASGFALAALAALTTLLLTGVASVAASVGLLAFVIPALAESRAKRHRADQVVATIPDFLARLRGRLAGGTSLADAFIAAGQTSNGQMAEVAMQAAALLRSGGRFAETLLRLRRDLDDPVIDRVLVVISSIHEIGGARVADVLGLLADSVADELRLRQAHEAALTQQRLSAAIALVAPWVLLVLSVATNPQSAGAFRTTSGTVVIVIGLVATALGYLLAMRTARLSKPAGMFR